MKKIALVVGGSNGIGLALCSRLLQRGYAKVYVVDSLTDKELSDIFKVNSIAVSRIIKHFYPKIQGQDLFFCGVMGSIAGLISSPMLAAYGASKAAVCKLIESLNIELEMRHTPNRILNVSPVFHQRHLVQWRAATVSYKRL
ncbi:glycerol-3-phosphate cytidylyltransferase [Candidatus Symbiothrix dinenymphae]|nr:glycerol-3-phosphate cytidylyltransferase [Candidatus Symbiothrix dinenymphae]